MKRFILLTVSAIVGLLVPTIVAYNIYASPIQKNAMPIWLLTIIGLAALIVVKIFWSWLVNSSSIAFRILLVFGLLDFVLIKAFYVLRNIEAGLVVISNNVLFLVGTTTLAGLFALWGLLTPATKADVDVDVKVNTAKVETKVDIDKE